MIDISEAIITNLIFHRIGIETDFSFVNDKEFNVNFEEEEEVVRNIFLKPFTNVSATYEFKHEIDIELNPLFKISRDIKSGEDFVSKSKDVHQHLKDVSKHPNIKDGDLFVVSYDNVKMGSDFYRALGIYKVEKKQSFIETQASETDDIALKFRKGIGNGKLDKAVLILFSDEPFTVLIIDNGSTETDYWIHDFINVDYRNDYVNSTNQFLDMTKNFITEQVPEEFDVGRTDQIDLLNRSVDYFKNNETYEKEVFEAEVLQDSNLINSFQRFDEDYSSQNSITIDDSFEISPQAVKKQARNFKSVLKLDKNFHVYIHGDKSLIEQGVDPDGRKFYKLFYEEED